MNQTEFIPRQDSGYSTCVPSSIAEDEDLQERLTDFVNHDIELPQNEQEIILENDDFKIRIVEIDDEGGADAAAFEFSSHLTLDDVANVVQVQYGFRQPLCKLQQSPVQSCGSAVVDSDEQMPKIRLPGPTLSHDIDQNGMSAQCKTEKKQTNTHHTLQTRGILAQAAFRFPPLHLPPLLYIPLQATKPRTCLPVNFQRDGRPTGDISRSQLPLVLEKVKINQSQRLLMSFPDHHITVFRKLWQTTALPHRWDLVYHEVVSEMNPRRPDVHVDRAKVRFHCSSCLNGWTTMRGRIIFHFGLVNNIGSVTYYPFQQKCAKCLSSPAASQRCSRFEEPAWYPEEAERNIMPLGNLTNHVTEMRSYHAYCAPEHDEDGTLDLRRKRVKKIEPAQTAQVGCSSLRADHNELARLDNVDTYSSLEKLSASHNQLIRMYGVGRLYSLRYLNLSYNGIGAIEGLRDLSHLTYLNLAGNNIKVIEHLNHCKDLQFVDLSENAITTLADLSYLKSLKKLFLHGNRIKSLHFGEKFLPASLDTLTLAENHIVDLNEVGRLCHLVNLEQFSFTGNPCITGNDLEFDYRSYLVNWLLSVRIIDGELVNERERLKGEWLYSQGKGRQFKPGEHEAVVEYLNRHCAIPKTGSGGKWNNSSFSENGDDRLDKVLKMAKLHQHHPNGSDDDESSASMSTRSNSTSAGVGRRANEFTPGHAGSPASNRKPMIRKVASGSGGSSSNFAVSKRRSRSPEEGTPIPTRRSVDCKGPSSEDLMSRSFDPSALRGMIKPPTDRPIKKQFMPELTVPRTPQKLSVRSTDEDASDFSDLCDTGEVVCASLVLKKDATRTLIPAPRSGKTSNQSPDVTQTRNTILRPKRSISVQPVRGGPRAHSPSPPKEESSDSDHKSPKAPKVPPRTIPVRGRIAAKVEIQEEQAAVAIQKVWRGYQVRNLDPKVAKVKDEIRQGRVEKHVVNIRDELNKALAQLSQEQRLRSEQSHLVDELKNKVQSLEAKLQEDGGSETGTIQQLVVTCSQLQNQVQQLQTCMESLVQAIAVIGQQSSNQRPTFLGISTEQPPNGPISPVAPGEVKEFARSMVQQLIAQAVTEGDKLSGSADGESKAAREAEESEKDKDEKEESSEDETDTN